VALQKVPEQTVEEPVQNLPPLEAIEELEHTDSTVSESENPPIAPPPAEPVRAKLRKSVSFIVEDTKTYPEKEDEAVPPSSSSPSSSSPSSSSSSEAETKTQPLFKLSLMFFMRMRRVVRDWAQRARETVAKRHQQAVIDAGIESALSAWRPPGVPMEIVTQISMSEALRIFRDGAVMMKRKGAVSSVDSGDGLFSGFKNQSRFFVGQVEAPDEFMVYFESPKAMQQGDPPKGSFTFEDMKDAEFNYITRSFAVKSFDKDNRPIMKKVSGIPQVFFIAIIMAIRYAISAKVRKDALLSSGPGSSGGPRGNRHGKSYLFQ
jgi:hypothetical protein